MMASGVMIKKRTGLCPISCLVSAVYMRIIRTPTPPMQRVVERNQCCSEEKGEEI